MTETMLIWLFGIMGAWLLSLTILGIGLLISQVKTNFAVNLFIGTFGEKIAKAMHNEDDHLKLDALLDRMLHGEKTERDYFDLKNQCNFIIGDEKFLQNDRIGAAAMAAFCEWVLITKFKRTKANV